MKKVLLAFFLVAIFLTWSNLSFAQWCIPPNINFINCFRTSITPQGPIYASGIVQILESVGGFLMVIAGVLAGIVIIVAGLFYMSAGSDTGRLTTAKAIFKNGIIGALIMFATGIILDTIALIALDPLNFFS